MLAQNPELLKDIAPSPFGSRPGPFSVLGNKLIFAANNYLGSSSNRELFISDGTPNGTQLLLEVIQGSTGSDPRKLISLYGKVYFAVSDNGFGPLVYRPWVTDGTAAGTFPLIPNPPNALGGTLSNIELFKPEDLFVAYRGEVYFRSSKLTAPYDRVIYKTNGTQAGTSIALELPNSNPNVNNLMDGPMVYKDSLYFAGTPNGGSGGSNLYKSIGTTSSIRLVKTDVLITPWNGWAVYNKKLYFVANTASLNNGDDPWVTDGTSAGTTKVADLQPQGTQGGEPKCFTRLNNKLVFLGWPNASSVVLYAIDSLASGNQLSQLATISPTSFPFTSSWLYKSKNKVYFRGNDNINGAELWTSDGSTIGTKILKDISPGISGSDPHSYVEYCDGVYFTARNPVSGTAQALYKTDGTEAGTVLIPGLASNPNAGAAITEKVVFNNSLLYSGQYETALQEELYKYTANCATDVDPLLPGEEITVFPNPSSDWVTFFSNRIQFQSIEVKNILGYTIEYLEFNGINKFQLNLQSYGKGTYFIVMKTNKNMKSKKLIIN